MLLGIVVRLLADKVIEQEVSLLTCGFGGWEFHILYPHVCKVVPISFLLFPKYTLLLVWVHGIVESKWALLSERLV